MIESNQFKYRVFYLCLDLDKLEELERSIPIISSKRPNIYRLHPADYINFDRNSIKENVMAWLSEFGFKQRVERIQLITLPRTFGYNFNPICFFIIYSHGVRYALIEVNNTFGEAKMFWAGALDDQGRATTKLPKDFYVSPFIPLDTQFHFKLRFNPQGFQAHVWSKDQEKTYLHAGLSTVSKPLTTGSLLATIFRYPLITIKVILGIHYEAGKLFIRRLPYLKKANDIHKQRGYYDRKHHSKFVS